jgi:two-component system sensor histidine kinase BaeS
VSLRGRVLGYLALAAVTSCALTVAVAVILVRHRVSAQRMTALVAQADAAAALDTLPGTRVYRIGARHPRVVPSRRASAVLAAVPNADVAEGAITVDGQPLLYVERPSAQGRLVLIRSAAIAFAEWRPFLLSLILAGLGGALVAALLAVALARRLTRPVAALAQATHRLAAGEEGVTVPAHGEDELADLGRSFNRMSASLAAAQIGQRRFLESVSHELRTPLTSIRGYAEALEEGAVSGEQGGQIIGAEAGRLERLVADLLDLARFGREGFAVQCHALDLGPLTARALQRHLPAAATLGVALSQRATEPAPALGDEDRLLQVISNLIENALRLTPEGGSVHIEAAPGRVSVRDTGPGIAPEDLPRAFERFYLHDRYRSERPVGSGLGLAIVQELVQAMHGSVSAAEVPGGGAEFTVLLPAADRADQPRPAPATQPS